MNSVGIMALFCSMQWTYGVFRRPSNRAC